MPSTQLLHPWLVLLLLVVVGRPGHCCAYCWSHNVTTCTKHISPTTAADNITSTTTYRPRGG